MTSEKRAEIRKRCEADDSHVTWRDGEMCVGNSRIMPLAILGAHSKVDLPLVLDALEAAERRVGEAVAKLSPRIPATWGNPTLECCVDEAVKSLEFQNAVVVEQMARISSLEAALAESEAKLNTPELHDFAAGVVSEAQHQRSRWGSDHDAGKQPEDWFWLLGYLGGKALAAAKIGDTEKALHHTISSAACLANWHAAMLGKTTMRPGIDPVEHGMTTRKEPTK